MYSSEVTSVRVYLKGEGDQAKKMVCLNNTVHVSQKQLDAFGYKNPKALQGNIINVEYYKVDEKMLNNQACTKADTIVKQFTITDSAEDIRLAKLANAGVTVAL